MNKAYGADDYYDDIGCSPWLQLNGEDFQYNQKLIDAFGIDREKLAPLAETGTVIGHVTKEVAARTGLAEGTPLIMGIRRPAECLPWCWWYRRRHWLCLWRHSRNYSG